MTLRDKIGALQDEVGTYVNLFRRPNEEKALER